jgi:hypothetical protein
LLFILLFLLKIFLKVKLYGLFSGAAQDGPVFGLAQHRQHAPASHPAGGHGPLSAPVRPSLRGRQRAHGAAPDELGPVAGPIPDGE